MKTIGILGGMSWESTAEYYRIINREVAQRLGGLNSASLLIRSFNFAPLEESMSAGDWQGLGNLLADNAAALEAGGAEAMLIATNTMHQLAPEIEKVINIPLLHIADAAGGAIVEKGLKKVGLLGTRFTMEKDFYTKRLNERYGQEVLVPIAKEREMVDRVIFEELCRGRLMEKSKADFIQIIDRLADRGAEGVVLGCTEIPLLVRQADCALPLFDTTELHARAAVDFALG